MKKKKMEPESVLLVSPKETHLSLEKKSQSNLANYDEM